MTIFEFPTSIVKTILPPSSYTLLFAEAVYCFKAAQIAMPTTEHVIISMTKLIEIAGSTIFLIMS